MAQAYIQEDDVRGKIYDSKLFRRLLPFIKPYTLSASAAIFLVVAGMLLFLVNPYIIGRVIDDGIKAKSHETIVKLSIFYIIIELLVYIAACIQNYLLQYTGQKIMYDIRFELFSHLQSLPAVFFDKNPIGRLVTRITNDTASLSELFSSGLVVVIGDIVMIAGIAFALIFLQPKLAFYTLSTTPVLFFCAWYFQKRIREAYREVRLKIASLNAALSENISGMRIIQIFNREEVMAQKFDKLNCEHADSQLNSLFYYSLFPPVITIINGLTMTIILFFGGKMVMSGEISTGILVSFISYLQHFFHPIRNISEKSTIFQSAMAAAEKIFSLLDEQTEPSAEISGNEHLIATSSNASTTCLEFLRKDDNCKHSADEQVNVDNGQSSIRGNISFENVGFSYTSGQPVLKNLSFNVSEGESIAIVGHTGAGKTTVASLLNRFYEINSGRILIDGKSISEYSAKFLRSNIAVIQQEVFIFSGDILENIRLWNQNISPEKVGEVFQTLDAADFIKQLPEGLETPIMERGTNLSAGQRQLIAFARALVFNPKILILDEATSSIDSESEKLIQSAIRKLICGRTSLIIAHRLSTINNCNRILVMHNGKLVESGSHEKLIQKSGYYRKLYDLQFKE
ncbi:MAG: ABC transporter ATP-binding protein [Candidatus Riflebacteria bacterium]|nr:ABC transporter ATP-binding protein [Candidatus Riflebacteria bacterium]